MTTKSFKDLIVWQKSLQLTVDIYSLTAKFPDIEKFGLVSQMRRCVVSIPSNIAEGSRRGTKKDFVQFLRIADGSAAELETQILIAQSLFLDIKFETVQGLLEEVQKMLSACIRSMQK